MNCDSPIGGDPLGFDIKLSTFRSTLIIYRNASGNGVLPLVPDMLPSILLDKTG
jgi:hypothetical protein